MSKISWLLTGMAIQAFLVALFLVVPTTNIDSIQQAAAGIIFIFLAVVLKNNGRGKQRKVTEN